MMGWEGPITHRQFVAWLDYLQGPEGTKPNLTHYYLMQVSMQIARVAGMFARGSNTLRLSDFELEFRVQRPKEYAKELTDEQRANKSAMMKSVWHNRLGI